MFRITLPDNRMFSIHSLNPKLDLVFIHQWVNMAYAISFWQMEGTHERLEMVYRGVLESPYAHSFIGFLDGEPVCQLDTYDPAFDDIGKHYSRVEGDMGIHLLMAPGRKPLNNFSATVVMVFAAFFFRNKEVFRIITEPDQHNRAANWLLRRLKFEYLGLLDLPEKTACLYVMTREKFKAVTAFV